jgi:hypothetical protein
MMGVAQSVRTIHFIVRLPVVMAQYSFAPAQLIAHILYYFSSQNDLVFDPMASGGVTPDTCLALSLRCWSICSPMSSFAQSGKLFQA